MKFGLFDHLDRRDEPLKQFYDERLKLLSAAEQAGFYSYHIAEHHGTPLGMAPSPSVFLGAVARHTETIRFGPMVYLLPLYEPLRLIEEICMLDNMSDGRLDLGVGRSVSPHEMGFYGIREDESWDIYAEALGVVLKGLTEERLNWESARYHYEDVPMELAPAQAPLPLWSAPATPTSIDFASRHGMSIVSLGPTARVKQISDDYRAALAANAGDPLRRFAAPGAPFIGAYRLVYVAETSEEADRIARPAFDYWFASIAKLWRERGGNASLLRMGDYDVATEAGMMIAGSAERVSQLLAEQIDEAGYNYPLLELAFGNLGHDREMASLALFAERVMPEFADA